VENAFLLTHQIGQFANLAGLGLHHDHLGAQFARQVHVRGHFDRSMMVVLKVGKLLGKLVLMMIVDERDCAQHLAISLPFALDEPLPDHVSDIFRTVRVPALLDQSFQAFEQRLLD